MLDETNDDDDGRDDDGTDDDGTDDDDDGLMPPTTWNVWSGGRVV